MPNGASAARGDVLGAEQSVPLAAGGSVSSELQERDAPRDTEPLPLSAAMWYSLCLALLCVVFSLCSCFVFCVLRGCLALFFSLGGRDTVTVGATAPAEQMALAIGRDETLMAHGASAACGNALDAEQSVPLPAEQMALAIGSD